MVAIRPAAAVLIRPTVLRTLFGLGCLAWAVALPSAALLANRPGAPRVVYAVAFLVYGLGSAVCHQLPERSFLIHGTQMPVCARCSGIYFAAAIAAIAAFGWRLRRRVPAGDRGPRVAPGRRAFVIAAVPTAATLLYEWTGGSVPSLWVRAGAGAPIGAIVAWLIVSTDGVD